MLDNSQIWIADSEVFLYDTLWCFKRLSDGAKVSMWNDPQMVQQFIDTEQPILCGYNFRDYDQYILKATLLNWCAEDIHTVSMTIINNHDDKTLVWGLFQSSPWVTLPNIIDLFHDIVPRKGLKEIEANIGMDIIESSVPFDIQRALTVQERDEVEYYCWHDVDATEQLFFLREDYVNTKITLCDVQGVDPLPMLKHTNARIVSEVLNAEAYPIPYESYQIPVRVDQTAIPEEVLQYVNSVNTDNCMEKGNDTKLEITVHDCPVTVALGGIHGAVPAYKETSSDDRVIFLQDVGSYYPSLILNEDYMSRAVSDGSLYQTFYDMRMEAKANGDTVKADAAKLVLNTTYGVMKDSYNKMFDPMQGTRVCLSGQLYILDLIEQMYRAIPDGLTLIQLNTDGWMLSCRRADYALVQSVVSQWTQRTGLTIDTDIIETIVQANVNNYVCRFDTGKIKAKGGVVANYKGGDFKSNSATIIDTAIVSYLLDGVPIRKTILSSDSLQAFQIIAKAGRSYNYVAYGDEPVQFVNRVFASTDKTRPSLVKVKIDDKGIEHPAKIPLLPEHCILANESIEKSSEKVLTELDKTWYIVLAEKKAKEFVTRQKKEKEKMADVKEPTNELQAAPEKKAPKRKAKEKTEAIETKPVATEPEPVIVTTIWQKLWTLQALMADAKVLFDGVVSNINYEYADTQQYKAALSQMCTQVGLIFHLDFDTTLPVLMDTHKASTNTDMFCSKGTGTVTLIDVDSGQSVSYGISGIGANVQMGYCDGVAQTNALRNFILNNFLMDNKGREGDDQTMNGAPEAKTSGYVSPAQKAEMKNTLTAPKKKFATDLMAIALMDTIRSAQKIDPTFCVQKSEAGIPLKKYYNEDDTPILSDDGFSLIEKSKAVACLTRAEEIIGSDSNE